MLGSRRIHLAEYLRVLDAAELSPGRVRLPELAALPRLYLLLNHPRLALPLLIFNPVLLNKTVANFSGELRFQNFFFDHHELRTLAGHSNRVLVGALRQLRGCAREFRLLLELLGLVLGLWLVAAIH